MSANNRAKANVMDRSSKLLDSDPSLRGELLSRAAMQVAAKMRDRFRPWTYDMPLAIRPETHERMQRIQALYLKCIRHMAAHYLDHYRELMPVPDRVAEILALYRHRPYRPGSYRTDFVIGKDNHIRLIETTCRFALNGFFQSSIYAQLAREKLRAHPGIRIVDVHTPFFDHLMSYFGSFERVCVLLGWNTARNESKYFMPIFEAAGVPVLRIPATDIPAHVAEFKDAAVMGELSHEELCALPPETVEAIVESNLLNDLRTVFLVHDKRFFALLQRDEFMHNALTPEERTEFRPYVAPTFTRHLNPELWSEAPKAKDRWILKPFNNGMSIDVFAGPLTSSTEWEALFDSGRADSMVLQEYVPQRKFRGTVGKTPREDYAAGTLLFFEDSFYGTGLFRASSHPVSNQGDDRKIAPVVTPDFELFKADHVL
ncbi:hypothetical protein GF324_07005 [bacterium]|nr:hypothetical protein [bacterium]